MDPLNFASNLAREAGAILRDRFWHKDYSSKYKSDHSLVTDADLVVDAMISDEIRRQYPQDAILSEEAIQTVEVSEHTQVWVVDPLDGTANFSNGIPIWGVSIARLEKGQPALGVLYFPLTNDLFAAKKGSGAKYNDQLLKPDFSIPAPFFSCCSRTHRTYQVSVPYKARISGSVAFNLASVARGGAAISIEVAPKIWDVAAAWVIVEEAGAIIEILAGDQPFPIRQGINYDKFRFSILAATNQEELDKAKRWIIKRI
jgi:myo-inositol-1(or 4)-monophosphatase